MDSFSNYPRDRPFDPFSVMLFKALQVVAFLFSIAVNGQKMSSPIRQETVSIRGIIAGEYTINVNHYLATTNAPVPVSVKVEKVNPVVEVIHYDTLIVDQA